MCITCDFQFPGGVHACPECAANPNKELSPRRKRTLTWAYVLAVWGTLGIAVLLSGVLASTVETQDDVQALGLAVMIFIFAPAVAGAAVGFSSVNRRLTNPPVVWVAAIWNGIILAILLLLTIVGLTM